MHWTSTRKSIQDALSYAYTADSGMSQLVDYHCRINETRKTGIEQNVLAIQYAKIRAAINEQKQPIPAWIHFAYGPDLESSQKARQKRVLGLLLARNLYKPPISIRRLDRIEKLCMCASDDYRLDVIMGAMLPIGEYCKFLGVAENHFHRDWLPLRDRALAFLQKYDSDGVGHISLTVREIREAEED